MAVWVLGDQLSRTHGPLADRPDEPVLIIESRSFARRYPCHPHKLTLVLSAMRHLRDELREAGREVAYTVGREPLGDVADPSRRGCTNSYDRQYTTGPGRSARGPSGSWRPTPARGWWRWSRRATAQVLRGGSNGR